MIDSKTSRRRRIVRLGGKERDAICLCLGISSSTVIRFSRRNSQSITNALFAFSRYYQKLWTGEKKEWRILLGKKTYSTVSSRKENTPCATIPHLLIMSEPKFIRPWTGLSVTERKHRRETVAHRQRCTPCAPGSGQGQVSQGQDPCPA